MIARYAIFNGAVWLHTPYTEDFLAELRDRIPARQRRWDADLGLWEVHIRLRSVAVDILCNHYDQVERVAAAELGLGVDLAADDAADNAVVAAFAALHLRPSAPPELVKVAHRTLAKLYHPDKGGDLATMQRINSAAAFLERTTPDP